MTDTATVKKLERMALQLRFDLLDILGVGKVGHLGGSSSMAEIAACLYFHAMRYDPQKPEGPGPRPLPAQQGPLRPHSVRGPGRAGRRPAGGAEEGQDPRGLPAGPPGHGPHTGDRGRHGLPRHGAFHRPGHGPRLPPGSAAEPRLRRHGRRRALRRPDLGGGHGRGRFQGRQPDRLRGFEPHPGDRPDARDFRHPGNRAEVGGLRLGGAEHRRPRRQPDPHGAGQGAKNQGPADRDRGRNGQGQGILLCGKQRRLPQRRPDRRPIPPGPLRAGGPARGAGG